MMTTTSGPAAAAAASLPATATAAAAAAAAENATAEAEATTDFFSSTAAYAAPAIKEGEWDPTSGEFEFMRVCELLP